MGVQWVFDKDFSFEDKNFADIYRFYTIETFVENMSKRGISLAKYGWNKKYITNVLKREIPSLNKNWKTITTKEKEKKEDLENIAQNISTLCKKNNIFEEVSDRREIFIHTNSKNNKTLSLLHAIRCAFAHGAFNRVEFYGEWFYFLENTLSGNLRGRIVAKEVTLLKIMEIIKNPEKYDRKETKNKAKKTTSRKR